MAMVLLLCVYVLLRSVGLPFRGAIEMTELLAALSISFAIAYCARERGHISVDILVARFSPRVQAILDSITGIIGIGLFALIAWFTGGYARQLWQGRALTWDLEIPYYHLVYMVAIGSGLVALILLGNLIKSLTKAVKK